jgi:hypothetical protein
MSAVEGWRDGIDLGSRVITLKWDYWFDSLDLSYSQ